MKNYIKTSGKIKVCADTRQDMEATTVQIIMQTIKLLIATGQGMEAKTIETLIKPKRLPAATRKD
jgi:hypothetical protein